MSQQIFWIIVVVVAIVSGVAHELRDVNGAGVRWRRLLARAVYLGVKGVAIGLLGSTITASKEAILAAVILLTLIDIPERKIIAGLQPFWGKPGESSQKANRL